MAANTTSEAIYFCKLIAELIGEMLVPAMVYCDNCIRVFKNPVFHDCSKHIDITNHFLWDRVKKEAVILHYVFSDSQVIDILITALAKGKFGIQGETGFS